MKSKQLVLEHLEDLSGRLLEESPQAVQALIRGRAGVYALYRRDKLYYVGLASNLMARLKQHLRDRHNGAWDRFGVYVTAHNEHMKELESLLLRILNPPGNKQSGKFIASKNLRSTLNQRLKEADGDLRALLLGGRVAQRRRRSKTKKNKGTRVLAGVVERRIPLKAAYKGYEYSAALRKDGLISYDGTLFESPSAAAEKIVNHRANGWVFWKYRNPEGNWVPLQNFRR